MGDRERRGSGTTHNIWMRRGGDHKPNSSSSPSLIPSFSSSLFPFVLLGSPFREEITMAILHLQENNRLEILKRRWWEGGQCPKEEDHRAKGQYTTLFPVSLQLCISTDVCECSECTVRWEITRVCGIVCVTVLVLNQGHIGGTVCVYINHHVCPPQVLAWRTSGVSSWC